MDLHPGEMSPYAFFGRSRYNTQYEVRRCSTVCYVRFVTWTRSRPLNQIFRALCALGALAAAVTSQAASAPLAASAFTYEQLAPAKAGTRSCSAGVCTASVEIAGAHGAIAAVLVEPARKIPKAPGILFVHWLGDDPKTTNHTEFEDDAKALARRGVVSLLVDAPWAQRNWFMQLRSASTDYAMSIDIVTDMRRCLDALQTFGVDQARVAYVGHDFGAMYGALLAGVDPRPKYYVLMAGTSTFAQWYLLGKKPADVDAYRAQMSALDPPQYLRLSNASAYLLQFATKDVYINADQARDFYDAAPAPKLVGFYATDHSLDVPQARADRIGWLLSHLGLR